MTWTNCGNKKVISMFDRDRRELLKESFNNNIIAEEKEALEK